MFPGNSAYGTITYKAIVFPLIIIKEYGVPYQHSAATRVNRDYANILPILHNLGSALPVPVSSRTFQQFPTSATSVLTNPLRFTAYRITVGLTKLVTHPTLPCHLIHSFV